MTNLLDLPLDQFRGYLAEGNYPQARQDELMRAYRAQNSLSGLLDRYGEEGLEGKNVSTFFPVAGPGGMSIFDALKSGQLQTRFKDYASDALGGVIGALENPRAAYQGTLPQADYDSAAMGTGGLAMGGGGLATAPAGSLRSFAGRNAKTADLDALKAAQELSARKRDPEDIFRQTGWFKGKDGQWRFEIDDSQAEFIGNSQTTGLLGDVMRHDALYAAYPDLKNTPVSTDVQRLQSGSYQPAANGLNEEIRAFGPTKPAILNTLLHEAGGHALQRREGFAPGSSRGIAIDQLLLEQRAFRDNLERKIEERQAEILASGLPYNDPELKRLGEQYYANVGRALSEDAIYERYYTEAGEVDARNIQLRQDMTPAERRALSPMATEDVPRSEQRLSGDGQSGLLAEAVYPVMQGRSRQGLTDFFNPDGVSWGTDSKSTAEQFAGKDAGLVYKYNDEGKLEVSEADSYLPGQVYDLNYDLENPMQVPIKDTLWTREKELAKIAEAKAKGHDGLKIVHGTPDADGKYPKTDYVAFDPSQVSTVDAKTAKKNRIAEMRRLRRIERFGYDPEEQPAPASGGFDAYLSTVNPSGKRIQSENRPNLRMGDMYGMLPKSAQKVSSVGDVDIMRDGDDFYAVAYNPDVGEMDVVGYAQRGEGETDLMVVQEMQGKGVGGELQYQYRSANPTAPTGGLTEAGEGLLRNTYGRLRDDGTVNANASAPVGLLAAQPSTEDELRQYLMQRGLLQ